MDNTNPELEVVDEVDDRISTRYDPQFVELIKRFKQRDVQLDAKQILPGHWREISSSGAFFSHLVSKCCAQCFVLVVPHFSAQHQLFKHCAQHFGFATCHTFSAQYQTTSVFQTLCTTFWFKYICCA